MGGFNIILALLFNSDEFICCDKPQVQSSIKSFQHVLKVENLEFRM